MVCLQVGNTMLGSARTAALSAVFGLFGLAGSASAAVIFFGDFSSDAVKRNSTLTNWNVTAGYVDVIGNDGVGAWYDWFPGNGAYVDLDGANKRSGRIGTKEALQLVLGETYRLSFDFTTHGSRAEPLMFGAGGYNGSFLTPTAKLAEFTSYSVEFTALEDLTRIYFVTSGDDNIGPIIDNVMVSGPVLSFPASASTISAAPVPAASPLMFSAVGGLVFAARRRRRA